MMATKQIELMEMLLQQSLPSEDVRSQLHEIIEREAAKSKLPERMHRFDVADVAIMAYSLGKIYGIRQERQRKKKKPCK